MGHLVVAAGVLLATLALDFLILSSAVTAMMRMTVMASSARLVMAAMTKQRLALRRMMQAADQPLLLLEVQGELVLQLQLQHEERGLLG